MNIKIDYHFDSKGIRYINDNGVCKIAGVDLVRYLKYSIVADTGIDEKLVDIIVDDYNKTAYIVVKPKTARLILVDMQGAKKLIKYTSSLNTMEKRLLWTELENHFHKVCSPKLSCRRFAHANINLKNILSKLYLLFFFTIY